MRLVYRACHFAARFSSAQTLNDAGDGAGIMITIRLWSDKFGFVDDPVDFLMLSGKIEECGKGPALGVNPSVASAKAGATLSRTCTDMSFTKARNSTSLESK